MFIKGLVFFCWIIFIKQRQSEHNAEVEPAVLGFIIELCVMLFGKGDYGARSYAVVGFEGQRSALFVKFYFSLIGICYLEHMTRSDYVFASYNAFVLGEIFTCVYGIFYRVCNNY